MDRAGAWFLCLVMASCATPGRDREPAGTDPSLFPDDRSIEQVFQTDDEAAKAACEWLRRNEPKAQDFEYCGFILRVSEGFRATVPMTTREPSRCPRPVPGPPGEAGWYHSHRDTNEFSWVDKSYGFVIATYLCAPDRLVRKLTPEGTVILK